MPQGSAKQAEGQNSPWVARWLLLEYPLIAAHAKDDNAEIHWGDEASLQSDANVT